MNNKLLVAALAAGIALPMAALPLFRLDPAQVPSKEMKAKEMTMKAPATDKEAASFSKAPAKRIITSFDEDLSEISKYGELELVLDEDFHRLTKGSFEEPYTEEILHFFDNDPRLTYPWTNMLPELTEKPGWGVGNAFAAGECVYFGCFDSQAHINTPMLDLSGEGGNVAVLEFKAKAPQGAKYNYLMVEGAETYNMAPSWDINENIMISDIGDEWRTIRLIYQNCGPYFIFNIVGNGPGEVFIDDVKVYKMKPTLHIPQPTYHNKYNGTDFTANWTACPGVDEYRLTVYEKEVDGTVRDYVLKDEIVKGTSHKVEGTVSGNIYYYTVAAHKEGVPSLTSMPLEVVDLETPKMEPIVENGDFGYTAKWNLVPGAEVYDYMAYYEREAEKDGEFIITQENFDGITDGDGNLTGWTKEDVQAHLVNDMYYSKWYPNHMQQRGWYGLRISPFTDYISLAGFFYGGNKWDNVGLISPELDLSKDGGKVTVSMDLAGEELYFEDENGKEFGAVETCAVVLFNWNEDKEDFDQVELVYVDRDANGNYRSDVEPVSTDWRNYTVTLTKGTSRSIIGIYAIWGISNLYVDNLKISQNYKKGEKFLDPFYMANYLGVHYDAEGHQTIEGGNTVDVTVPVFATGTNVYHNVRSVRAGMDPDPMHDNRTIFCESNFSDREFVRKTISGVESVEVAKALVAVNGDKVAVDNPTGATVVIYDLNGNVLLTSADEQISFTLPAKGLYIVAVGREAVKVLF